MVPLDRTLVSSYRLSIVTTSLTAAVWPQFATQFLPASMFVTYFTDRSLYQKLCRYVSNYVYISGAGNKMFET